MLGLFSPSQTLGMLPAFQQVRRRGFHIVRVRRKYMDEPLPEHPFGPVPGTAAKPAAEGAGRNLHPNTAVR